MHIDDIYFVSDQRAIVAPGDFSDAEARIKCLLPEQYKDLLTLTGLGEFCAYFRLEPPVFVAGYLRQWRENATQYHFWEEQGTHQVPPARLAKSIYLGSTGVGDSLVALPDGSPTFALVPEDCDHIVDLGDELGTVIERLCTSSEFSGPAPFLYFTPACPAQSVVATWMKQGARLPEVLDSILRLRMHDRWYTSLDESVTTILAKRFGGLIHIMTVELQEPSDSPPAVMKDTSGRYEAPPKMLDFFKLMSEGIPADCSDLPDVPPIDTWRRLPDIPQSVMVTVRSDADKAGHPDLLGLLNSLEAMGLSVSPPQRVDY